MYSISNRTNTSFAALQYGLAKSSAPWHRKHPVPSLVEVCACPKPSQGSTPDLLPVRCCRPVSWPGEASAGLRWQHRSNGVLPYLYTWIPRESCLNCCYYPISNDEPPVINQESQNHTNNKRTRPPGGYCWLSTPIYEIVKNSKQIGVYIYIYICISIDRCGFLQICMYVYLYTCIYGPAGGRQPPPPYAIPQPPRLGWPAIYHHLARSHMQYLHAGLCHLCTT